MFLSPFIFMFSCVFVCMCMCSLLYVCTFDTNISLKKKQSPMNITLRLLGHLPFISTSK